MKNIRVRHFGRAGVVMTHVPLGIKVTVDRFPSRSFNMQAAFEEMSRKVRESRGRNR